MTTNPHGAVRINAGGFFHAAQPTHPPPIGCRPMAYLAALPPDRGQKSDC